MPEAGLLPDTIFPVGDAAVARGSFVMEAASTIVEDGPALWMEQLTAAIERAAAYRAVGEHLAGADVALVRSSPLLRAQQTAESERARGEGRGAHAGGRRVSSSASSAWSSGASRARCTEAKNCERSPAPCNS